MSILFDLVRIIAPRKINVIETLPRGTQADKKTDLYQLFKGIQSGVYISEFDAERSYLQNGHSKASFRTLKHRLRKRLITMIFFLDMKRFDQPERVAAYYEANRQIFASRILIILGSRFSATKILEKTLKLSMKYQFTDLAFETSRRLQYNALLIKNRCEYIKYSKLTRYYFELNNAEFTAEEIWNNIAFQSYNSISNNECIQLAINSINKIDQIRSDKDSYYLSELYYRTLTRANELNRDYIKAIESCKLALDYFNSAGTNTPPLRLFEFHYRMLTYNIIIRDFTNGRICSELCNSIVPEGAYNWFSFMERYILLEITSGNFAHAFTLFIQAKTHTSHKKLPEINQEIWHIYELYLCYIYYSGWALDKSHHFTLMTKELHTNKLIKQIPQSVKDKSGMNIALLVARILYLLEDGNIDKISTSMDALKIYSYRYLNKPNTVRSKIFIKMLKEMDKYGYAAPAVRKHTAKLYDQLLEETPDKQPWLEEAEIIPYDMLWPRILKKLDDNHWSRR